MFPLCSAVSSAHDNRDYYDANKQVRVVGGYSANMEECEEPKALHLSFAFRSPGADTVLLIPFVKGNGDFFKATSYRGSKSWGENGINTPRIGLLWLGSCSNPKSRSI